MKVRLEFLVVLLMAFAANGQNASVQPKFEVASVKRTDSCGFGRTFDPQTVALRGMPLKPLLMEAFKVKMDQIEGPSWLETDCFDISAKIPDGGSLNQLSAMLLALLTDRFKLAVHTEDRPRSGYALVVDKGGPKLREDDPKTAFMGSGRAGQMLFGAAGHGRLKGVMTMATLAANLSSKGYGPVQDLTGLTGKYDIDLSWDPDPDIEPRSPGAEIAAADGPAPPEPPGSLFAAVRQSLGLKLERRKLQIQFVVIDHIERVPIGN